MLVLSRKTNEEIVIDNDIVIKIISVQNGIVKLGFSAPQDKVILRGELREAVCAQNIKATEISGDDFSKLNSIISHK